MRQSRRKTCLPRLAGLAVAIALGCGVAARAQPEASQPAASNGGFDRFVASVWAEASRAGVSRATFERAFSGLTPDPEVLELAENQPEFKTPPWQYLEKRVNDTRIATGREMKTQYADKIAAIEQRYGVDRHILLAIWGLESNYGGRKGEMNVIRSLATLGHSGSRQRFGRGQLIGALRILERGDIAPEAMTGSWAGAMGHTQFIPTTYNAYAVDWTGDGKRDIWNSIPDALASTANYLARSGWQSSLGWGREVVLPPDFDERLVGLGIRKTPAEWAGHGVRPAQGGSLGAAGAPASILLPAGAGGPAILVTTRNFRAVLAYNNAVPYALAVGHLADRIEGGGPFRAAWPSGDRLANAEGRQQIQTLLTQRGLDTGGTDGRIGSKTEEAIREYQRRNGLTPDGFPGQRLLERLRQGG